MELSYLLVLVSMTIFTIVLVYIKWLLQYWKRRNTPYLEPSFPFGNLANPLANNTPLPEQVRKFYERFQKMGAKVGGIYVFFSPVLIILDPEHAKQILIKDFQNFHQRGFYYDEEHDPLSVNLFTIDGPKWRTLRAKYSPTFTTSKIKTMFNLMIDVEKLLEKHISEHVANKKPLDVKDSIARVFSNYIGSCVFGINCNGFEDVAFLNILTDAARGASTMIKMCFCNNLPKLARFLRIPLIPRKGTEYLSDLIEKTLKYRKREKVSRSDFLDLVAEMEKNNVITMNELKASCILFFLAGFETSSNSTIFLLFELARNQDVQQKLREEIKEVLAMYNGEMTYEAVMDMKYLEMIICESLRRHSPLTFLNRKCSKTVKLSDSDIIIEKDTNIIVPVHAMQNDPRYFPDPEKFDPERFSDENRDNIVPYTYMPFGEGPRYCPGDRFAKQLIKVTTAKLVRKYKFRLNERVKLPLRYNFAGLLNSPADEILFDVEEIFE